MKAFVFKPSNKNIGRFHVDSFDELSAEFQRYAMGNKVDPYDYLECSGRIWTVMSGCEGLFLEEGRIRSLPGSSCDLNDGVASRLRPTDRYKNAYVTAKAIEGIGSAIKILGIVLGVIVVFGGVILASQGGAFRFFASLVSGVVIAIPIYVLGVLVSAQGQVLKATLDTAVNTSPFLDDEERAVVMSLRR